MNAFSGGAGRQLNCHFPWSGGGTYGEVYFDANSPSLERDRLTSDVNTTNTLWGQWNHWTFTKNVTDGTMAMYVNGDELTSGTGYTNHMAGINNLFIGSNLGSSAFYNGLLDEVRVYNYELSEDEIFEISRPPSHIEAEDYTAMSGVEFEDTTDVGGGINLSYIDNSDWAEYTIDVETTGLYRIDLRVAGKTDGDGSIDIVSGGSTIGSVYVGDTGGWQSWVTKSVYVEFASTGSQTVRLNFVNGGFNLNWFSYELAGDPVALNVGNTRNQMMRLGLDYERLWYWYGSQLEPVPEWSVNDCNIDYIRTAMNSGYELTEGTYDLSAYTSKIIPMMTAMQNANPNIKWFATPRPLNEADKYYEDENGDTIYEFDSDGDWVKAGVHWQPYPFWVTGDAGDNSSGFDFDSTKCAEYIIRYLLLMKSYGFKITYMDLTNEWQDNYASGGKIAPDDVVAIKAAFDAYLVSPWPHPALSSSLLLEADDFPLMVGASSWNYSQGATWISKFSTEERQSAIDIASSHNTDKTGTAQDFADQVHTTLGADTEVWETEQHGWKSTSSANEVTSFSYYMESIRAGFTGISGWLAIGTTSQGHSYLLNSGGTVTRNVKYYIFKKLSNTSNYGYSLDIDEPAEFNNTMALVRDNLLTVWVNNTSSSAALAEIDFSGHVRDGSPITYTRWNESLAVEGVEGTPISTTSTSCLVPIDGESLYCIEIPLVDNEDNFPFVQAESYAAISGATDQGSYVTFNAADSETSYDLDIVKTYPHDVAFRVSSASAAIAFDIYDGTTLIGSVDRVATGGAANWTTIYKTLQLDGGPMDLRIVAKNDGWNMDWMKFEQQFYSITETALDNLALGLSTNAYSASNVWEDSADLSADKAFDGDYGTRWASAGSLQYLQVGLTAPTLVNGARIYDYGDRLQSFEIQYSDDGITWHTAYIGGNPEDGVLYSFPTVSASYIRLQATDGNNVAVYEFELYYTPTPDVASMTLDGSSVSLEWSGVEGSTYALQSTTNLVDGFTTIESGIPVHEAVNMNTVATPDDAAFYRIIME
jgi:hypothetical protein